MFGTCIFCHSRFDRNDAIEHLSFGRRLAFDPAKGRLWVVCARCERWNLAPLETRWEAIEEAERCFRASRLRVSTDNIGLAQLKEGTELVRVGAPPPLELAGWRYGDQFGRRRRKTIVLGAGAMALGMVPAFSAALPIAFGGLSLTLAFNLFHVNKAWRQKRVPRMIVRNDLGRLLPLSSADIRAAELEAVGFRSEGWRLKVPYRPSRDERTPEGREDRGWIEPKAHLHGEAAIRALGQILPHVNRSGGSVRQVRDAVSHIAGSGSIHELVRNGIDKRPSFRSVDDGADVAHLPTSIRLALEMVLHEGDERRALDGEMHLLEERWREAEEIASIADDLLLPADIQTRLERLRQEADGGLHKRQ
jgi:hypothetical protein